MEKKRRHLQLNHPSSPHDTENNCGIESGCADEDGEPTGLFCAAASESMPLKFNRDASFARSSNHSNRSYTDIAVPPLDVEANNQQDEANMSFYEGQKPSRPNSYTGL